MSKQYSQEELDQILLSKKINEFYLAVIENRDELLTDEEYNDIVTKDTVIYGDTKEEVEGFIKMVETDERFKDVSSDIMKMMYSLGSVRHLAVITVIDDDVYDIGITKFVDLKRNKIIRYDNLANYYDETNARVRYFTPEEEPGIMQRTVLLDLDDESIIYQYEADYVQQEENDDLTSKFFEEVKGKPYTLKRNIN